MGTQVWADIFKFSLKFVTQLTGNINYLTVYFACLYLQTDLFRHLSNSPHLASNVLLTKLNYSLDTAPLHFQSTLQEWN